MINEKELRVEMLRNNFTTETLADAIGISRASFSKKLNGHVDFSRMEVMNISSILNLSTEKRDLIFFENKVAE